MKTTAKDFVNDLFENAAKQSPSKKSSDVK
jgi:hypothetical protein